MSNTKSAESTLSEPIFNRQALVRLILPLLAEQFLSVTMGMAIPLWYPAWAKPLCPA